jgi:ribonuclease HI
MSLPKVTIYTDGACSGNPGPGGFAAILRFTKANGTLLHKECAGHVLHTTCNEMEMLAVLRGLQELKMPCEVTIHTDSQLVVGWMQQGYKCKAAHILELKTQIQKQIADGKHTVTFIKVTGHSGDTLNERCDVLAKEGVELAKDAVKAQAGNVEAWLRSQGQRDLYD